MKGALVTLLVVLLLGSGLFLWWRDSAPAPSSEAGPQPTAAADVDAAASAEEKLSRLALDLEEAWLTPEEVTALLRHRPEVLSFGALENPQVEMNADTLRVRGNVLVEELPSLPELDAFRPLLPDTASLDVAGRLLATTSGVSYLEITSMEIARMPIPERFYPLVLERLSSGAGGERPPGTLAIPLPSSVGTARVEGGMLVLTP